MIPRVGLQVFYTLSQNDVRVRARPTPFGNPCKAGDVFPMVIVRVADGKQATDTSPINGQVFLDGNDTLWVTSRIQGNSEGKWRADYPA